MRKLKLIEHISLDGVIQITKCSSDDTFPYDDWTAPYRTPAGLAKLLEEFGERFDLVLGRRTYDAWSAWWPNAPKSEIADRINTATKYVVTHRPESLKWGPAEGIGPDLLEAVRSIKEVAGESLILSGSSTLTSAILEHGLADELLVLVYPVLLGQGKRLFAEGTPARTFEFDRTYALPSGILINSYKAVGPLKPQK